MLNEYLAKKQQMGTILKNAVEMEKLKRFVLLLNKIYFAVIKKLNTFFVEVFI